MPDKPEIKLTRQQVSELVECPDCFGHGTISTPSKNYFARVTCATCNGKGFVRKNQLLRGFDAQR